jgi:hypothetical protein
VATDDLIEQLAIQLGRPADRLVELDRRPLQLLVHPGSYITVTLRDRQSREVLEPTLDLHTGNLVDAHDLRKRDREAVERRAALAPPLRRLLLRHPDLPSLEVLVTRGRGPVERLTSDPAGILSLADDPDVVRIDSAGEAEIRDGAAGQ